jgi:hypothetical protein
MSSVYKKMKDTVQIAVGVPFELGLKRKFSRKSRDRGEASHKVPHSTDVLAGQHISSVMYGTWCLASPLAPGLARGLSGSVPV